jgi:RNA polymerase sigma-70 factor (ECF subfamily)
LAAQNVNSELQRLSDEELARQTQAGSLTAFEELLFRYEHRVYAFTRQFCRNPADAAEVTQETFLKAFRNIALYDPRRAFTAWLFTIARRRCIDHHRAAPLSSDAPAPEQADTSDPAEVLAGQEDRDSLWALARQLLPPAQFQALWLNYAADMKVEEIARVLNLTRTHIKVMLFRARRKLRRALEDSRPGLLSINTMAGRTRREHRRGDDLLPTARSASAPYP